MDPTDRKYTKEHEWVKIEGDRGTIGISDFAQKQLGDVVFLELPEPGKKLRAHERFGTVESVKAVSELFSPVSGEVVAVNADLATHPEAVNGQPHETWMIRIRPDDSAEADSLLDAAAYQSLVK